MPGALVTSSSEVSPSLTPSNPPNVHEEQPFRPQSWLPLFQHQAVPTCFVTLSADFVATLITGHVYLPPPSTASYAPTEIEWSDGTTETLPSSAPPSDSFGAAHEIQSAIARLGGAVSPKFENLCPIDATWANFHRSTKCTCPDDVFTMLKSSERVMAVMHPSQPATLALRQWVDIDPRVQFRLFIKSKQLIAVSHRSPEHTFRFSDADADAIVEQLTTWHDSHIVHKFTAADSYTMDVFIQRRQRVFLVDVAPWGVPDALLFSWNELDTASWMPIIKRAQFRSVLDAAVRPSSDMRHGLPVELRSADAMAGLAEAAQRLIAAQLNSNAHHSSDDDGDSDAGDGEDNRCDERDEYNEQLQRLSVG